MILLKHLTHFEIRTVLCYMTHDEQTVSTRKCRSETCASLTPVCTGTDSCLRYHQVISMKDAIAVL